MTTLFHARSYGRFMEIQNKSLERTFIDSIKTPIFMETVLAIEIM